LIVRDLQTLRSRLVEHGEDFGGLSPRTGAAELDVRDLGAAFASLAMRISSSSASKIFTVS
jgi:hypothetical protein